MHAYRDALPAVRAARVIYPGAVSRFFSAGGRRTEFSSLADALRRALAGEVGEGVGAIGWSPSD